MKKDELKRKISTVISKHLSFALKLFCFSIIKIQFLFFFFDNSIQMLLKLKKHMEFPMLKPYGIPDISHQALRLLVFSFLVLSLSTSLHHILLITPPLSGNSVSLKTGFKQKSCGQQQQVQVISRTRHYLPH